MLKNICMITVLILVFGCSKTENVPEVVELKTWQDSVSYSLGTDLSTTFKLRGIKYEPANFHNGFYNTISGDTSYAYGAGVASNFVIQKIEINPSVFLNAFESTTNEDTLVLSKSDVKAIINKYDKQLKDEANKKRQAQVDKNVSSGENFIKEYKEKHDDAVETESGLIYRVIQEGFGDIPKLEDRVIVEYTGKLIDGSVFDSSDQNAEPSVFRVNGLIVGWQEALTMMPVGSKWELVIPSNSGYGDRNSGRIPGGSTLIFEIELLGIE